MFLLYKISHMLDYVGSKIKKFGMIFFDNLFGDYDADTLFITAIALFWVIDLLTISGSCGIYGLNSPKAPQIMLFAAGIEFLICIIFSILTVITENINYHIAYYTRAVAMSFLSSTLVLVIFAAAGFLVMLTSAVSLSFLMIAITLGFAILTSLLP